ncbi:MAG: PadR family transcriptional regulator [Desulfobacteraceae bacterium]|nr:MAG: PadR family transcriptional regulator [Desulfobacteraceae bacterium]
MGIKYTILGLLQYKDMHGYRIKEHIERNFGHMWSINYGQIYPNLKKLEEEGLITMKEVVQNDEKGPPRKLYSITQKGREEFVRWLESSPEKSMILRDPFLMRFVFFGFGDPDRALELIDEQISVYQEQLGRRQANLQRWKHGSIFVNLIAELGTDMNQMILDWLEKARKELVHHFCTDEAGIKKTVKMNEK